MNTTSNQTMNPTMNLIRLALACLLLLGASLAWAQEPTEPANPDEAATQASTEPEVATQAPSLEQAYQREFA
ncbi:MAG TPA: hypothetical protein VIC53_04670, partial [Wenzhouxiangella sp.]